MMLRPVVLALAAAVATGCGGSDERLVVFAASSLTDVMQQVEADFEAIHGDVDVVVNVAGSSSLVAQIVEGAPADVLITADLATMERAREEGVDVAPIPLAFNDLVIAVEDGNPHDVGSVADLGRSDLVVVLAAAEVPAGRYASEVLTCAAVDVDPASLEQSVRAVAAKVRLGEADAGLVYRTDVGDGVEAVEIEPPCDAVADYAIAALGGALADEFVAAMLDSTGRRVLAEHGFELP